MRRTSQLIIEIGCYFHKCNEEGGLETVKFQNFV